MSKECYECDQRIGPTKALPGRHAGNMYLTLPAATYYVEDGKVLPSVRLCHLHASMPICLECVEGGVGARISGQRTEILTRLQGLYKFSQEDLQFKMTRPDEKDFDANLARVQKHLDGLDYCLACGCKTVDIPRATFVEFDRYQCRQFERQKWSPGFPKRSFGITEIDDMDDEEERESFFGPIYHVTRHNPEGYALFRLCMSCFATILPEAFHLFGWWLSDEKGDEPISFLKREERSGKPQLTIQTELLSELNKELGAEAAKELLSQFEVEVKDKI